MKQVTTMLSELLKIFPRYEFEKLEKQHQSKHYTKYVTGWQQLIKSFLGTSQNAVLTQIWVAMCYYLLLSYIKFQTKYRHSLQELTRMIAAVVMEQRLLIDILSLKEQSLKKVRDPVFQLALF